MIRNDTLDSSLDEYEIEKAHKRVRVTFGAVAVVVVLLVLLVILIFRAYLNALGG